MAYESELIESNIKHHLTAMTQLASLYNDSNFQSGYEKSLQVAAKAGNLNKVTLGFDDGRSFVSIPSESFPGGIGVLELYDPRTRPWFTFGRQSNKAMLIDVFFTRVGDPLTGVVMPVNGGALLSDIRLDNMQKTLENIDVLDGSLGIITDENGLILASTAEFAPVRSNINQLPNFTQLTSSQSNGQSYDAGENSWLSFSQPIDLTNAKQWNLILLLDREVALAPVYAASQNLILVALVITVISATLLIFILNYIYRPILSLKAIVQDLSHGNGDLTQRLQVNTSDDLGQIAIGINQFIEKLQRMMLEVKDVSENLSHRVESLRHHSEVSQEILGQHVAETDLIVTAVEELANTAGLVADNAKDSASLSHSASMMGSHSQSALQQAQGTIHTLVDEVDIASSNVEAMEHESQSIQSIVSVIGGIADQTNLLALNASIEAARAGEQGRGFAVVADEVRALAARTQQSTSEIESTLSELNNVSAKVVNAILRTKTTCTDMVSETQAVSNSLVELGVSTNQTNELSAQISSSADEQNEVIVSINQNIHHIHSMVEKMQVEMEAQHGESEQIAVINNQLEGSISQFKL
ncbi:hypothetical protein BCU68_16285 [Vibrio sp. 10N.286.49.B3]|nr:hypothetical protein BCU68_16285 [Vibrio sp. 10N.286.49.B3]